MCAIGFVVRTIRLALLGSPRFTVALAALLRAAAGLVYRVPAIRASTGTGNPVPGVSMAWVLCK